jgi:uncharacterized protein (TIGR00369 family)
MKRVVKLNVKDEHMNALGGVHGGVIFSLADIAFAMACNAGDAPYTGLQADIRYMSGAKDRCYLQRQPRSEVVKNSRIMKW